MLAGTTFVCVGLIISTISYLEIRNFFIDAAQADFSNHVQKDALGYFDLERVSSLKNNGDYKKYAEYLDSLQGISDVTVIDPSGIIIYSHNDSLVGSPTAEGSVFVSALDGKSSIEKINFKEKTARFIAPIKSLHGQVRGVVIANGELADVLGEINSFTLKVLGLTGVAAFLFFVITYLIFNDATKSIEEQDRSIVDKSKALKEEEELDEAIMESVAESLIVINKDGQIMIFNNEAERLTGFKAAEVEYRLYRKILKFYDKNGDEQHHNPIAEALKTGKKVEIKIKDGYYIKDFEKKLTPIATAIAPITTGKNTVRGVVATIQDITIEKELDKVKDEFVYVVAHELGNPIFAIDGYLSILDEKIKKSDKETKSILASAKGVNQQLSSLVNDLLEAVRNEQGQLTCELIKMDLGQILKEVTSSASFKAKTKDIKVTYLESKIPKVIGNEQKIREVATNLIDNAIKYTPAKGTIEIHHEIEGNEVITHVRDTGYGMTEEEQEKLFDKFYRIKNDDTKGISGTGLGLFICRQIVEKCGGRIWAESEKGKGSTFSFSLKKTK